MAQRIEILVGRDQLGFWVIVASLGAALFWGMAHALSLSFHDTTKVGDSLYRVAWDTYAVQTLLNNAIVPATTAMRSGDASTSP